MLFLFGHLLHVVRTEAHSIAIYRIHCKSSYPRREFDLQRREFSLFSTRLQSCVIAGAAHGAYSKFSASKKEGRSSVTIPSASTNALGYGAFLGLYTNLRYQVLCGFDQAMVTHFDVIGVAFLFSTTFRLLNAQLVETSRFAWLGVEVDLLAHSENLLKAYSRPPEDVDQPLSSKWFMSKNAIVSGLGFLGTKQGQNESLPEGEVAHTRLVEIVVRKKVSTNQA